MSSYFSAATVRALAILTLFTSATSIAATTRPLCVYVSSYHQGYAWSDGVEKGLRDTLEPHCSIIQFDMNTKRDKSTEHKLASARTAFELIEQKKPAAVITSDDNAAKYLIVPYLKNTRYPVVFSGVNWTVEEYGFPFNNVTGIVEVAPIKPMLQKGMALSEGGTRALYLGAATLTEEKNYRRINSGAERLGITLDSAYADTFNEWKNKYQRAQSYDFIIMGSNSGITDWDISAARQITLNYTTRPSLTNHEWMMPYTALGYTKIPEEHGQWAAQSVIEILGGTSPADIPLATNRKWDFWVNTEIIDKAGIPVSKASLNKAKRLRQNDD